MSEIFERILVALSGTESSQAAAALAFKMARLHGAEVAIVSVVDTGLAADMARVLRRPEEEVLDEMEVNVLNYLRHGETMGRKEGVPVETLVRRGAPYIEIASEAESRNADLVVLGSTHVEGVRRLAIGRVVERVIEHVACPVLVVRHRGQRGRTGPGS